MYKAVATIIDRDLHTLTARGSQKKIVSKHAAKLNRSYCKTVFAEI